MSVRESRQDCIKGGVHDRAGLCRVFQSSQKTTERCVSGGVKEIWFFFFWGSRSIWDVVRDRSWCGGVSGLQEKLQSDISVGSGRVDTRSDAFTEDALEGGGVAIINTKGGRAASGMGSRDRLVD